MLPLRLVGLLEHDLLQALPLYALIGALLNRLPLAGSLHRAGSRLLARSAAAPELAALGVGALLAPMNGSVGASLYTLSRSVAPALLARGVSSERSVATLCIASTLGVVIPPSLVFASPSPVPREPFVLTNGLKISVSRSAGMPTPLSTTRTRAQPLAASCVVAMAGLA